MRLLEVDQVAVKFGGRMSLNDVSLDAADGEITGLIGPNGAGKTTLFNVICGLQAPQRGTVRIAGVDVTHLAPFKRARLGLARTFQRLELFGLLSVRENLELAARVSSRPDPTYVAADLLERLGILDIAETRADQLSTGHARLAELGRALATNPTVLLLDEPASGQDERESTAFGEVLQTVATEGVSVVLVEHDIGLVMRICERIHVLDLGRVIASGTPTEIRQDPVVLDAYLGVA